MRLPIDRPIKHTVHTLMFDRHFIDYTMDYRSNIRVCTVSLLKMRSVWGDVGIDYCHWKKVEEIGRYSSVFVHAEGKLSKLWMESL